MSSDFAVVAIIAAYNEADIIKHVVSDLIKQDVQVYFLDDGSTDRTVAVVERFVGRGVLGIERLPLTAKEGEPQEPADFNWERILFRKTQLANELDASWFIHHDADEFRESPWSHLSLKDAIRRVDALGFNAIDFTGLDFWPVHDRFRAGQDVRDAFTFYSEQAPHDRPQIRGWKKADDLDLVSSGGHEARFRGRKVFPVRFILRHYPIRGQAHGERKVFQERRTRFPARERARGWHVQYDDLHEGASFIRDPSTLTPYDPDAVRLSLALRHRGIEELEDTLASLQLDVETLRLQLGTRTRELESRSAELGRTCAELATQTAQVARLRDELEKRAMELAETSAALEAHRAEIARLRVALEQRATEIDRWRAAVEDQARRLGAFQRSLSWRWTSPARAAYRMIRGR